MSEVVELEICHICDEGFQDLEEHFYDKHTSWKLYKCVICDRNYNSDKELQKHNTDFHSTLNDAHQNVPKQSKHRNQKCSLLGEKTCQMIGGTNQKDNKENNLGNEEISILYDSSQKYFSPQKTKESNACKLFD